MKLCSVAVGSTVLLNVGSLLNCKLRPIQEDLNLYRISIDGCSIE